MVGKIFMPRKNMNLMANVELMMIQIIILLGRFNKKRHMASFLKVEDLRMVYANGVSYCRKKCLML